MSAADQPEAVAIVGMAGRFPKAKNLEEFWRNLRDGVEAVSFFNDDAVQWLPIEHPPVLSDPRFVKARAVLEKPEWFDAAFFGVNPKEAEVTDPQHRVFLECCWEALEHAGCNPDTYDGLIGVFAGASMNTYLLTNLLTNRGLIEDYGLFSTMLLNDGDFVPTRVSYKLNLRGPSLNVQTACSTSLVAVCLAAQNLLGYRCDVALAGGVSITFPAQRGQHHLEGGILSSDGHCRTFDARASGTVLGDGAGVVVLKRLSDALADGDRICAVIKGTAINNDGAVKIGYTAPSVDGQAECIALAQSDAGIAPETISYVEAHGTGTPLGDPIEIAGLTKAFGGPAGRAPFCAVGSVKSNIGHLDIAAGVAGLIKTVLALQHGEIPPSLHFEQPNPKIDFAQSPFFVNAALRAWPRGETPRRAGVSSFGIGGTNAHLVLEEAPAVEPASTARPRPLLLLSAKTPTALDAAAENLAAHLEKNPTANLADVAFTLQAGRKAFAHRRAVVADDAASAIAALRARDPKRTVSGACAADRAPVAFLFPGQGAQAVNMAREIYETEPDFRAEVDRSCEILRPLLGLELREILFPAPEKLGEATRLLGETRITQPALFVIEHALARLWMSWGVRPQAMIGHSVGEYVAATLAGVFSLDDALALVAERARLMQAQPTGAMVAVRVAEHRMVDVLNENLALAAVNAPGLCVVSGPFGAIEALEKRLAASAIGFKRLATSHAFHSAMMEPALRPFGERLRSMKLRAPQIPWVSNLTGKWITPAEATSADYWVAQLRRTVRFADGIAELVAGGSRVLLEVGPGHTLAGLARQHPALKSAGAVAVASLGAVSETCSDRAALMLALGEAWIAGVEIKWRGGFYRGEQRRIVTLPTYPFERKRYWIEPGAKLAIAAATATSRATETPLVSETKAATENTLDDSTRAAVRTLLRELSGVELTPADDDATFYRLGFDSLFLTQASLAVSRRFGVDITFRQLREELPSVAKLADHLDARATKPGRVKREQPVAASATEQRIPLSDAQREIWYASQLGAAMSSAYNESTIIALRGTIDGAALRRAADQLVARHEALRTTFEPAGETQIVAPSARADVVEREFASEAEARGFIETEIHEVFDLLRGPLLRVRLARIGAEQSLLTVAAHHIVCDGWSLGILTRELAALYAAERGETSPPLLPAPQYSSHAARQARAAETPEFAAAEKFWVEQFADEPPALELPTDRPRPAERTRAGGFLLRTLAPEATAAVKRLCAQHDCTAFTLLLGAFAALLHRLSGQNDLVIGVPSAAQVMEGTEGLVGHFANLLPVRSRLRDDERFTDFLGALRGQMDAALEHWRYPFGRLLQKLNLARDSSRVPLAPVVFNTTRRRGALQFAGADAEIVANPKRFVNFDLNFNFALTDDTITLGCYYGAELFDAATIERWMGHFETLLRGIGAEPTRKVTEIPLLSDTERRRVLVEWNDTAMDYARDASIRELFEAQVQRTPEAIAVVGAHERWSYAELNRRADAIATRLHAAGVGRDTLVGIYLKRTPQLLAAIFGVLKAGGAYVPLDPKYPAERLAFIAEDTRMPVLVTERSLVATRPAGEMHVIAIDDDATTLAPPALNGHASSSENPAATDLAYIIYTSGSTGRPKGVAIVQRCVTALVAWAKQLYRPEELDGVLFATSASFDISIFEIFCPLCLGGKIILAENVFELGTLAAANEVRFLSGVPSALAEVVRLKLVPPSVTTVALAGEAFPQPLVDALYVLPHIRRVFELYGPTETTVYSTGALRAAGSRPSLGRPFPNERIYILDERRQPVPIGIRGEIYIAGDKLARGYLNRPELTAEKFIAAPFRTGERLYRSGDLGRWRPDGTIESLGRVDHQVKVRGFRVEPGEVEAALAKCAAVRECVVLVRADAAGNNRLLGYVVPQAGAMPEGRELREQLQARLPEHLVPSAIMVLEQWPLTDNGKLDRAALPEPEGAVDDANFTAPRTTTEEILVEIWRDVLALERVGVHDNFFELGGHSLLASQAIARVHDRFGAELTLQQFFQTPTVAGLAPAIEEALIAQIKATAEDDDGVAEAGLALAEE
ncbi:MAG TPA: amino acid adenylation domain-containing protein [Opitutaceae bacterium]|nr:amino acid adenylation domain-containing protein [Opitutaceae bacterium]